MIGFDISYVNTLINIDNLKVLFKDKSSFIKADKPLTKFLSPYGKIVLIDHDTIIYDYKQFGEITI